MTRVAPPTKAALRVFAQLCRMADRAGVVEASRRDIAAGAGLATKSVSALTKSLEEYGMLAVEEVVLPPPFGRVRNRYTIPRDTLRAELARQANQGAPRPHDPERSEPAPELASE